MCLIVAARNGGRFFVISIRISIEFMVILQRWGRDFYAKCLTKCQGCAIMISMLKEDPGHSGAAKRGQPDQPEP